MLYQKQNWLGSDQENTLTNGKCKSAKGVPNSERPSTSSASKI